MEVNMNEQKPNKIKSFFKNLWDNILRIWDKFSAWMDRGNKTTVIFLFPYVLMFMVFIVLPIIIAIGLSFTYFNGIQTPSFVGFDNYIYIFTQDSGCESSLKSSLLFFRSSKKFCMFFSVTNFILFLLCINYSNYHVVCQY